MDITYAGMGRDVLVLILCHSVNTRMSKGNGRCNGCCDIVSLHLEPQPTVSAICISVFLSPVDRFGKEGPWICLTQGSRAEESNGKDDVIVTLLGNTVLDGAMTGGLGNRSSHFMPSRLGLCD